MNHEAEHMEQLQAAIEALAAGGPRESILSTLPPELHAMAETGAILARAGHMDGQGPGVSFVLGLEEQLRTDLRLGPPATVGAASASPPMAGAAILRIALVVVMLAMLGSSLTIGMRRALPGEAFYGFKRQVETLRRALSWQPASSAELRLDEGWQRLLETEAMLNAEALDRPRVEALLGEMSACYAEAMSLASEADAPRIVLRADGESRVADQRLRQMADEAPSEVLPALERARAVLAASRQRLAATIPFQPVPIAGGKIEVPGPSETPTSALPRPSVPPVSPTAEGPPASATPIGRPTRVAPSATPAPLQPSATPLPPASATKVPENPPATRSPERPTGVSPTQEPRPTRTSPPPEPTGTNAPSDPRPDPTWTSEPIWPTDPPEPTKPPIAPPSPEPPASPEPGGGG